MELTKEYFDKTLDKVVKASESRVIARIDDAQEELARMTKNGFDDVLGRLDVRERVSKLEKDMVQMKTALNLN